MKLWTNFYWLVIDLCQSGNTDFIYRNEFDKACFQHDMAYGKSSDLAKRTQSDKVLSYKVFKIASDPKYDDYQRGFVSMVYKFFDKSLVEVVPMLCLEINLLLNQIINVKMYFINRLLEYLREEKLTHPSEIISGLKT